MNPCPHLQRSSRTSFSQVVQSTISIWQHETLPGGALRGAQSMPTVAVVAAVALAGLAAVERVWVMTATLTRLATAPLQAVTTASMATATTTHPVLALAGSAAGMRQAGLTALGLRKRTSAPSVGSMSLSRASALDATTSFMAPALSNGCDEACGGGSRIITTNARTAEHPSRRCTLSTRAATASKPSQCQRLRTIPQRSRLQRRTCGLASTPALLGRSGSFSQSCAEQHHRMIVVPVALADCEAVMTDGSV